MYFGSIVNFMSCYEPHVPCGEHGISCPALGIHVQLRSPIEPPQVVDVGDMIDDLARFGMVGTHFREEWMWVFKCWMACRRIVQRLHVEWRIGMGWFSVAGHDLRS